MKIFTGPAAPYVSIEANYLTAWRFYHDAPYYDVRSTCPYKVIAVSSPICEPDLIVHTFESSSGNLHIRIPHKKKVKTSQRQFIVKQALKQLENEALQDSATQPVALLLVGDCNLVKETAEQATQGLQPDDDELQFNSLACTSHQSREGR